MITLKSYCKDEKNRNKMETVQKDTFLRYSCLYPSIPVPIQFPSLSLFYMPLVLMRNWLGYVKCLSIWTSDGSSDEGEVMSCRQTWHRGYIVPSSPYQELYDINGSFLVII